MARDNTSVAADAEQALGMLAPLLPLAELLRPAGFSSLAVGLVALGISFVAPRTHTSRISTVPPKQNGTAAGVLSSPGALADFASGGGGGGGGSGGGIRSPAKQLVGLLQRADKQDRVKEGHKLIEEHELRSGAEGTFQGSGFNFGSLTRGAEKQSIFVVQANSSVMSAQQDLGEWFGANGRAINDVGALRGELILVPMGANKSTFLQNYKDWTQILSQFVLGMAAIQVLK